MRALSQSLLLGVLAFSVSISAAQAQEYSAVPTAVEQIGDATLQSALAQYSPNYNYLVRSEQIRAYANIYQSLYGTQPALTAQDTAQLSQPQQVYVVPSAPTVYYYDSPPVYYYNPRPGFSFDINIGGGSYWGRPGWGGYRPPPWGGGPGHRPGGPGGRPGGGRPGGPRPR